MQNLIELPTAVKLALKLDDEKLTLAKTLKEERSGTGVSILTGCSQVCLLNDIYTLSISRSQLGQLKLGSESAEVRGVQDPRSQHSRGTGYRERSITARRG